MMKQIDPGDKCESGRILTPMTIVFPYATLYLCNSSGGIYVPCWGQITFEAEVSQREK